MTLTQRLFILALVALLPAIAIQTYHELVLRDAREAEVRDQALRSAQQAASELERIFEGVRNLLTAVAKVDSIRTLDTNACVPYLAVLQSEVPHLVSIAALDLEGRVRCRQDPPPAAANAVDRSYFQEVLATGGFVIGEFTEGRLSGKPVLPLALPLRDEAGRIIGAVIAALDLRWLTTRLLERGVPPGGSVTVADRNGVIIARYPLPEQFIGTRIPDDFQHLVRAAVPGALDVLSQDGTRRVLGYVPAAVPPTNVYVSAGLSTTEAYAAIDRASRQGLIVIALGALIAMTAAWAAGRLFIKRPVDRLLRAAAAWRAGDLGVRTGLPAGRGEFETLGQAFDGVVAEAARREEALRDSEERTRVAIEAGRMGTWWLDAGRRQAGWSERAALIFGLPADRTTASFEEWLQFLDPADRAAAEAELNRALAGRGDCEIEYRVIRPDGTQRWINARGRVHHEQSEPTRITGVLLDVTERKEAELRQRLLLDELNHRVKNTLATVQSIATQTLRTADSPEAFRDGFEARLIALSRTHDLLTRGHWQAAALRDLLEKELAPYGGDGASRYELAGPDVKVDARTALVLGLAFHELTTNAAKHGALANPEGRIGVHWAVRCETGDGVRHLRLAWTEAGAAIAGTPSRQGFGSRLLERSITQELGGTVRLAFEPGGLRCEIEAPLERISPREEDDAPLPAAAQ